MLIDNNLTWKQHIDYINEKISKTAGIIARLRHFIPLDTLKTIYKALLSSYLSYGIITCGQPAKTHANQLFLLQKRALHLMHFGHYTAHESPYFLSSNILPLNMLYLKSVAILMYDSTNNFTVIQHY